jgi:hypothetical protein
MLGRPFTTTRIVELLLVKFTGNKFTDGIKKQNLIMRTALAISVLFLLLSCNNNSNENTELSQLTNMDIGNEFIDAFYSFSRDSLQSILKDAKESQPEILYYQKWAECANYKIVNRAQYVEKNDSTIIFPITVKDDLMAALKINFNVTDSFHILIKNRKIRAVKTSSNDAADYYKAKEWVNQHRPELVKKACEGIWEGVPTPCECVQGMVKGFTEFTIE